MMALINIGVFMAVLVLGYFIGWHSGAEDVLNALRSLVEFKEVTDGED